MKTMPAIIVDPDRVGVRLRVADDHDRETLRLWKNENKRWFFHHEDITPEQQALWFGNYLGRPDDHVYLVEEKVGDGWIPVGIVACRLLGDTVDLYNIMRGRRIEGGRANMGEALTLLCTRIGEHYDAPITCKVLSDNPTLTWYERLGFCVDERRDGHHLLRYVKGAPS
jgi:ribosomal protein S18 acetylase RimI-like enzyme